ncbi:MAG: hypothetical protein AAGN64_15580 [Bacteroidota bacterium]
MYDVARLILDFLEVIILGGTAWIVLKYTRETVDLRRAAQDQNSLISEQVRLAQRADERAELRYEKEQERQVVERERERSMLDPILESQGGFRRGDTAEVKVLNSGGSVRDIEAEPLGNFLVSLKPDTSFPTGRRGVFELSGIDPSSKFPFVLRFAIQTGERREKHYYFWSGNVYEGRLPDGET